MWGWVYRYLIEKINNLGVRSGEGCDDETMGDGMKLGV